MVIFRGIMVVTLDTNKNRIIIYSQEIQLYEIVNYEEKQDNENDEIFPFPVEMMMENLFNFYNHKKKARQQTTIHQS